MKKLKLRLRTDGTILLWTGEAIGWWLWGYIEDGKMWLRWPSGRKFLVRQK